MVTESLDSVVLALIIGLVVGSFLTVVVERVPAGKSVVWPSSSCGCCGSRLRALDLIPVVSWLFLRGRCRICQSTIPVFYPIVELVTGIGWGVAALRFNSVWAVALAGATLSLLVAVKAVGLRHRVLPDSLLVGGLCVTAPLALLSGITPWAMGLAGALVCWAATFAMAFLAPNRGVDGGDVKLATVLGLALGLRLGLLALVLAAVARGLAALAVIVMRSNRGRGALLMRPFLTTSALLALFLGEEGVAWLAAALGQ